MRLDAIEKKAIELAINDVKGEVFLFGSRVDNDKKGGDVDLLIFSASDPYSLSKQVAVEFFKHCEEKIDVVVMDPDRLTPTQEAFLNLIHKVKIR